MTKQAILLLLALAASSCSVFKKDLHKSSVKEHTIKDSTAANSEHSSATERSISSRTITERIDTTLVIAGSSATATGSIKELVCGETIRVETADQVLEVKADPATGKILLTGTVKPKTVPVSRQRTTIENVASLKRQEAQKSSTATVHQVSDRSETRKDLNKTMEGAGSSMATGFVAGVLLVAGIILYILWRRRRRSA